MDRDTSLTPELKEEADRLAETARNAGLDFFPTVFEVVDYQQLNEIAAYGGFPTRYPHWRWGMEYERLSKSYTYGLSLIYEMVINTNPCYPYLLRANSMVYQKTVMAHVYGHCDFFKNNYWFSKTNRKMLDQMANHASTVRKFMNEVGQDEVEDFIDTCLALDNLIDIHGQFKAPSRKKTLDEIETESKKGPGKLQSKNYMDKYVNPSDFLEAQKMKIILEAEKNKNFPERPERDILKFLIEFAPIKSWQRRIIEIIRDEAYYFAPQGQTKIMNEGWATYWHSKMMTQLAPLHESEIVDYCDHYAGVVASQPGRLNPYKLGVELLRHIEKRWDEGKFGIDYLNCDDPKVRREWNKKTGQGRQKIFEVRKFHNDITFIDEFLDEDFCHDTKMFIYDIDPRTGRHVISSRDFKKIKQQLLNQITNFGQPIIDIVDANFRNRSELLLAHQYAGVELKHDFAIETLKCLHKIWNRPVHIETWGEDSNKRISWDGHTSSIEKA